MEAATRELRLLHDLTVLISEAEDVDRALRAVLKRMCAAGGWTHGEAWLLDPDGGTLERGPSSLSPALAAEAIHADRAFASDLAHRAWSERRTVGPIGSPARARETPSSERKPPTAVAVPLLAGSTAMGVLLFFATEPLEGETSIALATMVAAQLGLALGRKRSEDALREKEERLRLLLEHLGEAVIMLDPMGRVLTWTPSARRILGHSEQEALLLDLGAFYAPEDRARDLPRSELRDALETGRSEIEGWRLARNGTRLWVRVVTTPVRDSRGEVRGFAQILQDRTALRQAEELLSKRSSDLERSNRELETFASVASHDLQEPLRKIRTFASRLTTRHRSVVPPEAADLLDRMDAATLRMQCLIDDLLAYSRLAKDREAPSLVDLEVVAREVLGDLEASLQQSGASVKFGFLPAIYADAVLMRQLFQNLLSNAIKFRRPGVPPVVSVEAEELPDGNVRIDFQDNGIGFDPIYAERIFGVFQRLHGRSEYEGTGMGLAISRRIVERHGGTIVAEGRSGAGALFRVTLPNRTRRMEGSEVE